MEELEQELEIQEQQEIEQVENTYYYYDKICDDKHLGSFTESTSLRARLAR